mgnify:CR=1 FL=1
MSESNEFICFFFFFVQAEDGIRDAQKSRGLGDVYKRQEQGMIDFDITRFEQTFEHNGFLRVGAFALLLACLLYPSYAADDLLCVDLGGRPLIKKKKNQQNIQNPFHYNT